MSIDPPNMVNLDVHGRPRTPKTTIEINNPAMDRLRARAEGRFSPPIPVHLECFTWEEYEKIVQSTIKKITELAHTKGAEYAGDEDRLANFRRNGLDIGIPMETVWRVYAGKHWDAISQFIKDLNTGKRRALSEPMEGRVDDLIVYLLLFKCMLAEGHTRE